MERSIYIIIAYTTSFILIFCTIIVYICLSQLKSYSEHPLFAIHFKIMWIEF